MNIGYACLALGVPGTEIRGCVMRNATGERLSSLIANNLASLKNILRYNRETGIRLFRISSDIIPFGSSPVNRLSWWELYAGELGEIGRTAVADNMRLSMHPGQYTILNAPSNEVAARAAEDLVYHAKFLDSLGLGPEHKIVLHVGGAYGDKAGAMDRFAARFGDLPVSIKRRLALENDDTSFHIRDVLSLAGRLRLPVVYDALHNAVNGSGEARSDADWILICASTWKPEDGRPKIHYAQQHPGKRPGAHADSIDVDAFLNFCRGIKGLDVDIMLEVKDKNLSAVKCMRALAEDELS